MAHALHADARRDPAWLGRVFWTCAALALLFPALVACEFKLKTCA